MAAEDRGPLMHTHRHDEGAQSERRAGVRSVAQGSSLGKAEIEEGRMTKSGSVRIYLLSGTLGGTVGATGCGSLLTPAAIGMSRQSNE